MPQISLLRNPVFLFVIVMKIYSIVNQMADCVTDVISASEYYHGSEAFSTTCISNGNHSNGFSLLNTTTTRPDQLTDHDKVQKDGIAEPAWFFLTISFFLIPQVLRYVSNTTEELLEEYFGKLALVHGTDKTGKTDRPNAMVDAACDKNHHVSIHAIASNLATDLSITTHFQNSEF